jgi:hypothetical protein
MLVCGHGLVFSGPYGYSPATVNPWRFSQGEFGVRPYTSVDENFAMRGVGVSFGFTRFDVCLVASAADFDASVDGEGRVTSLSTTGYHTDERETKTKDALGEDLLAVAVRAVVRPVEIKLNLAYSDFDRPFTDKLGSGLAQKGNLAGSLDLAVGSRTTVFFAEAAGSKHGGEAYIAGLAADTPTVDLLVLGRSYGPDYMALHGRAFAHYSGRAVGERGLMMRLTFKPVQNGRLSVASDLHQRSGSDDAVSKPSGSESFLDFELKAGDFVITLGEKIAAAREPPATEGDPTEQRMRFRSRIDLRYVSSARFWMRARYENLHSTEESGAAGERFSADLMRLDFGLGITKTIDVKCGVYTFDVEDYAARLYQYEAGLPYYPSLQMLKTDGSRWYSVISCGKEPFGRLVTKFGRTSFDDGSTRTEWLFYYNLRI